MTRINYRFVRNPFVLFVFAPLFLFLVLERFPSSKAKPREKRSVHIMNFSLLIWCLTMSAIFGVLPFIVIQVTMMAVAGTCGIWLFYVQHQFEDTYWAQEKTGTSPQRQWKEVVITNCQRSCSGFRETLDFTISIT